VQVVCLFAARRAPLDPPARLGGLAAQFVRLSMIAASPARVDRRTVCHDWLHTDITFTSPTQSPVARRAQNGSDAHTEVVTCEV